MKDICPCFSLGLPGCLTTFRKRALSLVLLLYFSVAVLPSERSACLFLPCWFSSPVRSHRPLPSDRIALCTKPCIDLVPHVPESKTLQRGISPASESGSWLPASPRPLPGCVALNSRYFSSLSSLSVDTGACFLSGWSPGLEACDIVLIFPISQTQYEKLSNFPKTFSSVKLSSASELITRNRQLRGTVLECPVLSAYFKSA